MSHPLTRAAPAANARPVDLPPPTPLPNARSLTKRVDAAPPPQASDTCAAQPILHRLLLQAAQRALQARNAHD